MGTELQFVNSRMLKVNFESVGSGVELFSVILLVFLISVLYHNDMIPVQRLIIHMIITLYLILWSFYTTMLHHMGLNYLFNFQVTASAWINDLRNQIEQTRILSTVYRSASALGSRLPSIASARAKVAGAGAMLQPVSNGTQVLFLLLYDLNSLLCNKLSYNNLLSPKVGYGKLFFGGKNWFLF